MADEIVSKTSILDVPTPNKEKNPPQRSINISDIFLTRFLPPWSRPPSLPAYTWRAWVLNQPIAMVCRETLIAYMLSLDWSITPRDPEYREELNPTIKYYTNLLNHGGNYLSTDWTGLIEWIGGDLLDIPFGGAAELGRRDDSPTGRVMWIRPLDGGTLYPTLNSDYPVVQYYQGYDAVAFPAHAIARAYISPHQYIWREGWGMAPPEKAYFALDLLNRGDKYYANLLLDIPTAGILDLGDMEKGSAEEWAQAYKTFVNDTTSSFRIPVLYEHNNPINFLSLGKVPNDIMFDRITLKYAAILSAAYGLGLSDIGLQSTTTNGETLAGSIRQERRTRKIGVARVKAKLTYWVNQILPESLQFNFIDYDDELNVALGRARLASATAMNIWLTMGAFSAQEVRSQTINDGLVSLSFPDKIPSDAHPIQTAQPFGGKPGSPNKEPEQLGNPKPPSAGGEGEIKSVTYKAKTRAMDKFISNIVSALTPKIYAQTLSISEDEIFLVKSMVQDSLFSEADELGLQAIIKSFADQKLVDFKYDGLDKELRSLVGDDTVSISPYVKQLQKMISSGFNEYIGKAVSYVLNSAIFDGDVVNENSEVDYEKFVSKVQEEIYHSLPKYINSHVQMAVEQVLFDIQADNQTRKEQAFELKRLETVEKSKLPPPKEPDTIINLPDITTNLSIPERKTEVQVTNQAPNVTVQPPDVRVHVDAPEMPDVNVQVEKSDINIPPITVNVPEPVVNVNVEAQQPPTVNVNVEPTPVEVKNTVNMPEPKTKTKKIVIHKDGDGKWTGESK